MSEEVIRQYPNGEITVVWKPALCVHCEACFRGLPKVFDPKRRPWVKMDEATTLQIAYQVDQCPSGALSYQQEPTPSPPASPEKGE